ncbi:MAG: DUF1501 domain-containing protein, partial [Armatimonadetes bacterium]|nr:DUF1501 domain-containing protein [Armatimonadota bacterium]
MLTIRGTAHRLCDGGTRRDFLRIGGLAMGGLALPQVLEAQEQSGSRSSHKAVILVYLTGGPPHLDTVDLKPDAPEEIRGLFKPIESSVKGIQVCEHMPRLAKHMDKFALIRSLVGARDEHASDVSLTGYPIAENRNRFHPSIGSVVSRLRGPAHPAIPAFVDARVPTGHTPYFNEAWPGFLGLAHAAVRTHGPVQQDMTLKGITLDRLSDRKRLLGSLDQFRRDAEASGVLEQLGGVKARAFDLLTSNRLAQALDISKEDAKTLELYGKGSPSPVQDASPMWNEQFLIARRLVEAGVRVVTIGFGSWDFHSPSQGWVANMIQRLDQSLAGLVQDLHNRGLDKDVTVAAWGDFGRSPKLGGYMNNYAAHGGREHWPLVAFGILAGGGMRTGQVIGATNKFGEYADERPVHYRDAFA